MFNASALLVRLAVAVAFVVHFGDKREPLESNMKLLNNLAQRFFVGIDIVDHVLSFCKEKRKTFLLIEKSLSTLKIEKSLSRLKFLWL